MYIYIYVYIGESDSLANYYYIYASNLNQQTFMHRYDMSILYIYAHMHFTLVSQIAVHMITINHKGFFFRLEELEQNPKGSHPQIT